MLVHPCDVFSDADVAALVGAGSAGTRLLDKETRMVCDFRPPGGGSGPLVHIEAQRNTAAAGHLEEFRKQREDAIEVRPVRWSEEGDLRISVFPNEDDGISVALWAYVITSDYIGRDVFIWVQVGGRGDPATFASGVESMAETLKDAILAAQP